MPGAVHALQIISDVQSPLSYNLIDGWQLDDLGVYATNDGEDTEACKLHENQVDEFNLIVASNIAIAHSCGRR